MTRPFQRDYWPTTDWRRSSAEAQGMDPGLLPKLEVYARDSQPQITALMVVRHGYIVFEEYYGGFGEDSYFSLHSITKSVLSALIGSALRSGAIRTSTRGCLNTSRSAPLLKRIPANGPSPCAMCSV